MFSSWFRDTGSLVSISGFLLIPPHFEAIRARISFRLLHSAKQNSPRLGSL